MPKHSGRPTRGSKRGSFAALAAAEATESGYILIGVIFFVALVLLSLAVAAPKVAAAIQRDRELELVNRGEQYKRAIKLYYKKFGSYPGTMEQLEKTNNIRFLRKRYLDPLTGKDDWKLIHMGEAHLRPLGFFGKPLTVTTGATNLGAGLGTSTTLGQGSQTGNQTGSQSGGSFGSSSFGSSSFGSSSSGSSGTFGGSTGAGNTISPAAGGNGSGLYAGVDNSGSSSSSGSGTGSSSGTGSGSSTGFGTNTSQTLGGAPIVGVLIPSEKASILEYKLQKTYKDWEFVYDPAAEQAAAAGGLLGGTANLNGSSGTSTGIGGTGGTTGFGNTGGTGLGGTSGGFGGTTGTGGTGFGTGTGTGSGSGSGSGTGFGSTGTAPTPQ